MIVVLERYPDEYGRVWFGRDFSQTRNLDDSLVTQNSPRENVESPAHSHFYRLEVGKTMHAF